MHLQSLFGLTSAVICWGESRLRSLGCARGISKLFVTTGPHCLQCNRCNSEGHVCLSSVPFRCFVEMNEATIMRFSLSGSKIILVSGEVKIVEKFAGDHP